MVKPWAIFVVRFRPAMTNPAQQDITGILAAWNGGDADALDRLMDLLYPELRRIAHQHLDRRRAGESLESAALANEAYLKLVRAGGIRCENRAHFLAFMLPNHSPHPSGSCSPARLCQARWRCVVRAAR